ncbi:MAG: hypothetical protein J5856_08810 [Lachnospiraceae bacterium]|nr:hypothetical protein [Lachnospiraceae bacterium]
MADNNKNEEYVYVEKKPFPQWILYAVLGIVAFGIYIFITVIVLLVALFGITTVFGLRRYVNAAVSQSAAYTSSYTTTTQVTVPQPNINLSNTVAVPDDFKNDEDGDEDDDDDDSVVTAVNNDDNLLGLFVGGSSYEEYAIDLGNEEILDASCCLYLIGEDKTAAEEWVYEFFPDSVTELPDTGFIPEYWIVRVNSAPMKICIGSIIFDFDSVEIDFDENGLVRNVNFFKTFNKAGSSEYFDYFKDYFVNLYGEADEWNIMNDNEIFSMDYYIWNDVYEEYDLYLSRTYGDENEEHHVNMVIAKY